MKVEQTGKKTEEEWPEGEIWELIWWCFRSFWSSLRCSESSRSSVRVDEWYFVHVTIFLSAIRLDHARFWALNGMLALGIKSLAFRSLAPCHTLPVWLFNPVPRAARVHKHVPVYHIQGTKREKDKPLVFKAPLVKGRYAGLKKERKKKKTL